MTIYCIFKVGNHLFGSTYLAICNAINIKLSVILIIIRKISWEQKWQNYAKKNNTQVHEHNDLTPVYKLCKNVSDNKSNLEEIAIEGHCS